MPITTASFDCALEFSKKSAVRSRPKSTDIYLKCRDFVPPDVKRNRSPKEPAWRQRPERGLSSAQHARRRQRRVDSAVLVGSLLLRAGTARAPAVGSRREKWQNIGKGGRPILRILFFTEALNVALR
jgi:hypothetical protein